MKKIFIIIILLFIQPSYAEVLLEAKAEYNVNSARKELLNNPGNNINKKLIDNKKYDSEFNLNRHYLLKGQTDLKDRTLALFSDSTYGVMYYKDQYHVYYYNPDGTLLYIEQKDKTDYPYRSYKYDVYGRLVNMSLRISKGETYIYTPEGKLIAHWINNNGYDESGNIIMKRNIFE